MNRAFIPLMGGALGAIVTGLLLWPLTGAWEYAVIGTACFWLLSGSAVLLDLRHMEKARDDD